MDGLRKMPLDLIGHSHLNVAQILELYLQLVALHPTDEHVQKSVLLNVRGSIEVILDVLLQVGADVAGD